MIPVLTAEEMSKVDAASTESVETLMERAGMAISVGAAKMGIGYGSRVAVLCGPGNNGGDGYVSARYIDRHGAFVTIVPLFEPRSYGCKWAASTAEHVRSDPDLDTDGVDLIVDAVFGGGFRHGVPEKLLRWAGASGHVLAVDLPTGLDPTTGEIDDWSFEAERTVTFHTLKTGHVLGSGPDVSGTVDVVDIGLSGGTPLLLVAEEADCTRPARSRSSHKWEAGSVLVVGGSTGLSGAASLCAQSALRFGAGSVGVVFPGGLDAMVPPEILEFRVGDGQALGPGDASGVLRVAERFDVIVIGPGIGRAEGLVGAVLERWRRPIVLDADGLNSVSVDQLEQREGEIVLTPHAGEFTRLTGVDADYAAARRLAATTESVVLLKGSTTFVCDRAETWVVKSGGPELATIGTGDVLAGMLGALWARGLPPAEAARSAAFWHGIAGWELSASGTLTADRLAAGVGGFAW